MKKMIAVSSMALALFGGGAQAILITQDTAPNSLAAAVTAGATGLTVISATLQGQDDGAGAVSTGTYTNASGTYGIGPGIVLSTGNVSDYNDGLNTETQRTTIYGPAATAAQETLLDPISGGTFDHFDVTQLDITFTTSTGAVFFNVVFGSEEFPEYVGNIYIDGFGLYLDGTNIAFVGGQPVNINHPDMAALTGTELDGILAPGGNPVLTFSATGLDTTINHTLTFILADTSDESVDTTVYISMVPEPATWALFGLGLAGLRFGRMKRQSQQIKTKRTSIICQPNSKMSPFLPS